MSLPPPGPQEALELGEEGQSVVHVGLELEPLGGALHDALLLRQHRGRLAQLDVVALQIATALLLQEVELLAPALVQRDVFAHEGIEAEVGVGRQQGVQHGVDLWWGNTNTHTHSVNTKSPHSEIPSFSEPVLPLL